MIMNSSQPEPRQPRQYTVAEAARFLKVCQDTVYDLVKGRHIKSRRKGPRKGRIYFLESDLRDYLGEG